MHELSLVRSLVSMVVERAQGRRVVRVRLRIGRLAGVEVEAVRFCFDVCTGGTAAAGAALAIEEVEGRAACEGCGAELRLAHLIGVCPCERRAPLRILGGEELLLVNFEMEA